MDSAKLYNFIKKESEIIPIALIRNSLVKQGYSPKKVDEAVRKVTIERREKKKQKDISKLFSVFEEKDKHIAQSQEKPVEKHGWVPVEALKKKESSIKRIVHPPDIIKDLKKSFNFRKNQPASLEHIAKREHQGINIKNLAEQTKSDNSAMQLTLTKGLESKPIIQKHIAPAFPHPTVQAGQITAHEDILLRLHDVPERLFERKPVRFHWGDIAESGKKSMQKFLMRTRKILSADLQSTEKTINELDSIKVSYFTIAIISAVFFGISIMNYKQAIYPVSISVSFSLIGLLAMAKILTKLENKYNFKKNEKKSFELALGVGLAGLTAGLILKTPTLLTLIYPGFFAFSYFIKQFYNTDWKTSLKVSFISVLFTVSLIYLLSAVAGIFISLKIVMF